jgi:hypothetical protein
VLRSLGRILDERGASVIYILETPDGFEVRYQDCSGIVMTYLAFDELYAPAPRPDPVGGAKRRSVDKRGRGTYQDFLRALGYELNDLGAKEILIDQVDDVFLVTYQAIDPHSGLLPHKHMAVLGKEEIQALMNEAYARRQPTRLQRWGLGQLLGFD